MVETLRRVAAAPRDDGGAACVAVAELCAYLVEESWASPPPASEAARHSDERTPYQQLANRFGISRERTRQLEHNALRKLRHCAEAQTAAA